MQDQKVLIARYGRQIAVEQIGRQGQIRLINSKVLIIGCGALGSMVAIQLSGAGIGYIGIADFDNIEISNLQRQFFFNTEDVGKSKVNVLAERIKKLNPTTEVKIYQELITTRKAEDIIPLYDFIIDATDNPESKKMIGKISKEKGKACCIGGVKDFQGQIMTILPDDNRFEDFFGVTETDGILPCSLGGVMGPTAALCASMQACEAIKFLSGNENLHSSSLQVFNLLTNNFQSFSLPK